jgi:ribulose 1,5-bisphosphate synthetase/thiazole synthase
VKIACVTSLNSPATSVAVPDGAQGQSRSHETEVVVIGSGLGGLCCAAMLATYGVKVISALEGQHCAAL